jgi:GntR family transcriptional regulator, transcriptional repressor for pyruvate dehydrogenase complex
MAAQALIQRIEESQLAPGTRLPSESELARMLGVGRSTIREALNGLALLGVIEIRHGQGTFVASQVSADASALEAALKQGLTRHLLEARLVAEVAMVQLAAVRATDEELEEIEQVLDAYEDAARAGEASSHLGAEFHMKLLEAAHNDVLIGFVRSYMPQAMEQGRWLDELVRHPDFEAAQHRELFEATRARDPGEVGRLMIKHLTEMSDFHMDLLTTGSGAIWTRESVAEAQGSADRFGWPPADPDRSVRAR